MDKENIFHKINENLKSINKKTPEKRMSLREQRFWKILGIVVTIVIAFFAGGLFFTFDPLTNDLVPEYSYEVAVSPDKVILNNENDIKFTFNFTNNGKKDIERFYISKIDLFREEGGKIVFKKSIHKPDGEELKCKSSKKYRQTLEVGETCVLEEVLRTCQKCFDDKDKQLTFFIYIESSPPLENKQFNLTIY